MNPSLTAIYAVNLVGTIGNKGMIPWYLPEDPAFFKKTTQGKTVIMGRKTWESLPENVKPLPNRQNIVLSYYQNQAGIYEGASVCLSMHDAVRESINEEMYIIGGAEVIKSGRCFCSKEIVTVVNSTVDGDCNIFQNDDDETYKQWPLCEEQVKDIRHQCVFKNLYKTEDYCYVQGFELLFQNEDFSIYEIKKYHALFRNEELNPIWSFFEVDIREPYKSNPKIKEVFVPYTHWSAELLSSFFYQGMDYPQAEYFTTIKVHLEEHEELDLDNIDIEKLNINITMKRKRPIWRQASYSNTIEIQKRRGCFPEIKMLIST